MTYVLSSSPQVGDGLRACCRIARHTRTWTPLRVVHDYVAFAISKEGAGCNLQPRRHGARRGEQGEALARFSAKAEGCVGHLRAECVVAEDEHGPACVRGFLAVLVFLQPVAKTPAAVSSAAYNLALLGLSSAALLGPVQMTFGVPPPSRPWMA